MASATWELPGSGMILDGWRLSGVQHSQSGTPYSLRYTGDPTGTTLNQCSTRGCQAARPGERNTARGDSIVYTDFTLARIFRVGDDRIEFRADIFNAFNQWNVTADGYVGVVTAANFGQHSGGSAVWPGRQFQFAYANDDVSFDLRYDALMQPMLTREAPPFNHGTHIDQPGRVSGRMVLRGEEVAVDCIAMRDRSWGIRKPRRQPKPAGHRHLRGLAAVEGDR